MSSMKVSLELLVDERNRVFHWTPLSLRNKSILSNMHHEWRHQRSFGNLLLTLPNSTDLESSIWREIHPHDQCLTLCIIPRGKSIDKGNIVSFSGVKIPRFLMLFAECRLSWLMTEVVDDTTSFENGRTFRFSRVCICATFLYPPSLAQSDLRFIHHDAIEKIDWVYFSPLHGLNSLSIDGTRETSRVQIWPLDWAICKVIGKERPSTFVAKLASTIVFITTCLNSFWYPIKGMPWIRSYCLSVEKREEIAYFALRITNDQILFVVQSTIKVAVQPTTDIHQIDLWRGRRTKSSLLHMVRRLFSLTPLAALLYLSPDIKEFSASSFPINQSTEMWLWIVHDRTLVTDSSLLSLLSKQRWAQHTSFTSLTRQTLDHHPHSCIYIPLPIQSMFIHVRIFQEREREKKREGEARISLRKNFLRRKMRREAKKKKAMVCIGLSVFLNWQNVQT